MDRKNGEHWTNPLRLKLIREMAILADSYNEAIHEGFHNRANAILQYQKSLNTELKAITDHRAAVRTANSKEAMVWSDKYMDTSAH